MQPPKKDKYSERFVLHKKGDMMGMEREFRVPKSCMCISITTSELCMRVILDNCLKQTDAWVHIHPYEQRMSMHKP